MTEQLPTRCLLHQILYRNVSPYGVPYAVTVVIDPAGKTHTALACSKRFGDLDQLSGLEGHEVNLLVTSNGLQLMPLAEQPVSGQPQTADGPADHHREGHSLGMDFHSPFFPPDGISAEPSAAQESSTTCKLKDLAMTVAKLARDLKLPTAMWIHFP